MGLPARNRKGIRATLDHLARVSAES
jgi:hypothetical protein